MGDTQDPKSLCVWLPEGDYQRATWRTVVRVFWDSSFACCLWAKKPEETWRLREPFFGFSLGTGMWEIWIYVWGYLIFFGEDICKMNRNRNKSKVWGVSHPERWSQTFSQRDLWSSFHGRILQCRPATPNRPNRPNGPNGSEDYAGCWGIPSGAGLVGQRLEVPRSIAGQGHWSRVDLASFVEHLVQLM